MPRSSEVGVVGDDAVVAAVRDATGVAAAGTVSEVLEAGPDLVVAGSRDALCALAGRVSVPVLAVDVDAAVPSVARAEVAAATVAASSGRLRTVGRRLLEVRLDGNRAGAALCDVAVVPDAPARISEYVVESAGRRVARFRADGVVVATPTGTDGYAGAAGGPRLEPGTRTVAVVPIAPFRTVRDHWVLADEDVVLSTRRDQPVVLVVDGTEVDHVPSAATVELASGGELRVYDPGGDWKNSNGRGSE